MAKRVVNTGVSDSSGMVRLIGATLKAWMKARLATTLRAIEPVAGSQ